MNMEHSYYINARGIARISLSRRDNLLPMVGFSRKKTVGYERVGFESIRIFSKDHLGYVRTCATGRLIVAMIPPTCLKTSCFTYIRRYFSRSRIFRGAKAVIR